MPSLLTGSERIFQFHGSCLITFKAVVGADVDVRWSGRAGVLALSLRNTWPVPSSSINPV